MVKDRSSLNLRRLGSAFHLFTLPLIGGGEIGDRSDSSGDEKTTEGVCTGARLRCRSEAREAAGAPRARADSGLLSFCAADTADVLRRFVDITRNEEGERERGEREMETNAGLGRGLRVKRTVAEHSERGPTGQQRERRNGY